MPGNFTSKVSCANPGCENDTFRIEFRSRIEGLVRGLYAICTKCERADVIPPGQ